MLAHISIHKLYQSIDTLNGNLGIPDTLLVESMRKYGVITPLIVVRTEPEKFIVLDGDKRLWAATHLGIEYVPCHVIEADPKDYLKIKLLIVETTQKPSKLSLEIAIKKLLQFDPDIKLNKFAESLFLHPDRIIEILGLNRLKPTYLDWVKMNRLGLVNAYGLARVDKNQQGKMSLDALNSPSTKFIPIVTLFLQARKKVKK